MALRRSLGKDADGPVGRWLNRPLSTRLSMALAPLPPAPERALGWLLGGRDGRLLLVALGALLGAPLATLAAVTATSAVSLGLRVAFLRPPPARDVSYWS